MEQKRKSKTSSAVKNRYIAKAYDRVNLTLYKGGKDIFSEHAKKRGESLNSFIQRAMRQTMEQDGGDVSAWDALAPERDAQEVSQ